VPGASLAELLRLAWPIALGTLSYALMSLVDTLFVGRLGAEALAGVGLAGVLFFLLLCFSVGTLRAVKVLTSHAAGAGRYEGGAAVLGAGLLAAVGLGIVTVAAGHGLAFGVPALIDGGAGIHARTYLETRALAAPMLLGFIAVREHRYGLGDSRGPLRVMLTSNVLNIGLDAIFIFVLGLGVRGAALATVVAHASELAMILLVQRADGLPRFVSLRPALRGLWHTGWPAGLHFLAEMGAFSVMTLILASSSAMDVAAHQIALQLVHLSFMPSAAIAEAGSVLIGRAIGGERRALVLPIARRVSAVVLVFVGSCGVTLLLLRESLAACFTDEPALIAASASLLAVAALFQVADGLQIAWAASLRGTGDVRFPAFVTLAAGWGSTPALSLLLVHGAGWGARGGWLAMTVQFSIMAVLFWHRLIRRGDRAATAPIMQKLGSNAIPGSE
jgi:MATE family multidrug resistance protein